MTATKGYEMLKTWKVVPIVVLMALGCSGADETMDIASVEEELNYSNSYCQVGTVNYDVCGPGQSPGFGSGGQPICSVIGELGDCRWDLWYVQQPKCTYCSGACGSPVYGNQNSLVRRSCYGANAVAGTCVSNGSLVTSNGRCNNGFNVCMDNLPPGWNNNYGELAPCRSL